MPVAVSVQTASRFISANHVESHPKLAGKTNGAQLRTWRHELAEYTKASRQLWLCE